MLEHSWDKHIVALLQALAQKHGARVNVSGGPRTLLDVQVVEAEFAIHLHLEMQEKEMLYCTQIIVFAFEEPSSSTFFIPRPFLIPLTPSRPNFDTVCHHSLCSKGPFLP